MSILGGILAWCGSGLNNVTEDVGAEINKELSSGIRLSPIGSCLCYPLGQEY